MTKKQELFANKGKKIVLYAGGAGDAAKLQVSVVMPVLNARAALARSLPRLLQAACVGEAWVIDGGSQDGSAALARSLGARVAQGVRGRGTQLALGADSAVGEWLLFWHADTLPGRGWERCVALFLASAEARSRALAFRFGLRARGVRPRLLEKIVAWRCAWFALPYGDQGLLIHRDLYRAAGGYPSAPLMEDVALVRRLGRRRLRMASVRAWTSAVRYQRDGYTRRMARNAMCLALYGLGVKPETLARLYR